MRAAGIRARRKLADDAFVPFVQRFVGEGDGTVPVPLGAVSVTFRVWGPGGGGSRVDGGEGLGGGAGAYSTRTVAIDPADAGELLLWRIYPVGQGRKGSSGPGVSPFAGANGAGIAANITNWTGNINCHQGYSATVSTAGAASVASGGTTDTNGTAAVGQTGGAAPVDPPVSGVGKGGNGSASASVQTDGQDGGPGCVEISWS